jgi:hypothetical protein
MNTVSNPLITRLLSEKTLLLGPCGGGNVFNHVAGCFPWFTDPEFLAWNLCNPQEKDETAVEVYENTGVLCTVEDIFTSFGRALDTMAFTLKQVAQFHRTYKELIPGDGYGTYFLLQGEDGQYFLARIEPGGMRLKAHRLDYGQKLYGAGDARLVIPAEQ